MRSAVVANVSSSAKSRHTYHETEMSPLAKEVSVHVDTVRLAQVLGDERTDNGEVLAFEFMLVLHVAELDRGRLRTHKIHARRLWYE